MQKGMGVLAVMILICGVSQGQRARSSKSYDGARLPGTAIAAMQKIDPDRIRAHVRFLADDLLEGRGTGQRGGELAAQYIATQFALYGLKPAGENGSYMQKVPMVGVTAQPDTTISIIPDSGAPLNLKMGDD